MREGPKENLGEGFGVLFDGETCCKYRTRLWYQLQAAPNGCLWLPAGTYSCLVIRRQLRLSILSARYYLPLPG